MSVRDGRIRSARHRGRRLHVRALTASICVALLMPTMLRAQAQPDIADGSPG